MDRYFKFGGNFAHCRYKWQHHFGEERSDVKGQHCDDRNFTFVAENAHPWKIQMTIFVCAL